MDKALNYLALAKKGRLIELGEEPVGAITRAVKGRLVIVASDASDHTWRPGDPGRQVQEAAPAQGRGKGPRAECPHGQEEVSYTS